MIPPVLPACGAHRTELQRPSIGAGSRLTQIMPHLQHQFSMRTNALSEHKKTVDQTQVGIRSLLLLDKCALSEQKKTVDQTQVSICSLLLLDKCISVNGTKGLPVASLHTLLSCASVCMVTLILQSPYIYLVDCIFDIYDSLTHSQFPFLFPVWCWLTSSSPASETRKQKKTKQIPHFGPRSA